MHQHFFKLMVILFLKEIKSLQNIQDFKSLKINPNQIAYIVNEKYVFLVFTIHILVLTMTSSPATLT